MVGFFSPRSRRWRRCGWTSALSSQLSYRLYGVTPPLDQCSASVKLPVAMSAFQAFTLMPWKFASIPAFFSSCAAIEPTSA